MVRRVLKRTVIWVVSLLAIAIGIPIAASLYVNNSTNDLVFNVNSAPACKVALVLGTSRRTTKRQMNDYYVARMRTAAELYAAGKVQYLLVSGDNGTLEYNEPDSMRRDLLAMGVPENRIALDFAGFDTFDSMIRAQKVWGVDTMLVVSQDFQVRRAVYIAQHRGIVASGVVAVDPFSNTIALTQLREIFARVKMLIEVHVLHTQPRFLGPHESFPLPA